MKGLNLKLEPKVIVTVGGLTAACFLIFLAVLTQRLEHDAVRRAGDLGTVLLETLAKTMERSMVQGDMEGIQAMVVNAGRSPLMERVGVVNAKGVVTQSSQESEIGNPSPDAAIAAIIVKVLAEREATTVVGENEYIVSAKMLVNDQACRGCHDEVPLDGPLGAIFIKRSIRDLGAEVTANLSRIRWFGIAFFLVLVGSILAVMRFQVIRKVKRLASAARRVAEGEHDVRVDFPGVDEISQLAEAFNTMVTKVHDQMERSESILRSIADPMITVDRETILTYMNRAAADLLGFEPSDAVGKLRCRDLFGQLDRDDCIVSQAIMSERVISAREDVVRDRKGRKVPVLISVAPIKDARGEVIGGIEIFRDISAEKEAKERLADETAWSRSVIQGIPDPMITLDCDRRITHINQAMAQLLGLGQDAAIGKSCAEVLGHRYCAEGCLYLSTTKSDKSSTMVVEGGMTRGGKVFDYRIGAALMKDASGKTVGFMEILTDITERNETIHRLSHILERVASASERIKRTAQEMLATSEEQKKAVSEQSASVREVSTTVEELDVTSQQTAERGDRVVDQAGKSVEIAQEGKDAVRRNIDGMNNIKVRTESVAEHILQLSDLVQQIGGIVTAVNDIADQTNLLALNASIEAARAGEHGKGFAVVAMEVKKLAEESQRSTGQIAGLINQIQDSTKTAVKAADESARQVEDGVVLINKAGDVIESVRTVIDLTADAVQQIAATAKQQSIGIQQVSFALNNINVGMKQTTISAEALRTMAENYTVLADELSSLVTQHSRQEGRR
jgi:methyl-accepting chemotaxis protein